VLKEEMMKEEIRSSSLLIQCIGISGINMMQGTFSVLFYANIKVKYSAARCVSI
jgi:hypothetical protein